MEKMVNFSLILIISILTFSSSSALVLANDAFDAGVLPRVPVSDFLESLETEGANLDFCAEWNPEFAYRGYRCCWNKPAKKRKRGASYCAPGRSYSNFCGEMTDEQRRYTDDANSGKLGDLLQYIERDLDGVGKQSFCSVNNGFLAHGRRLIPTTQNRIRLRSQERCVDFGTDRMVAMVDWLGRRVNEQYSAPEYKGVDLVVGDISAPRGGCLAGRSGRRGHSSHMSGLDVDLAFLVAKQGRSSPLMFHTEFDAKANWWLLKELFRNPYACVKVVFLDRKHINKLAKAADGDPLWPEFRRFIRHVKFHKNHFHVRVGEHAGAPGCEPNANPELEVEEEYSADDNETMEELRDIISNSGSGT
jgi:murein endopeptidase